MSKRTFDDADIDTNIDTVIYEPRTPIREPQTPRTPSTEETVLDVNENSPETERRLWTEHVQRENAERNLRDNEARRALVNSETPATIYAGKLTGRFIFEMIDGVLVPVTTKKLLARFKQYYYEDGEPIPKSDITGKLVDDMMAESGGKKSRKTKTNTNRRQSNKRKINKKRSKKTIKRRNKRK
jgi:beta-galactosidase GanA